jgi:hypothetical protein
MENSYVARRQGGDEGSVSVLWTPEGLAFLGFAGLAFAGIGVVGIVESVSQFGWTETSGLVIQAFEERDSNAVVVRFVDDREQTWELEIVPMIDTPSVESTVEVRYPPGDPERFTLDNRWEQLMWGGVVPFVIGALMVLGGFTCSIRAIRARRGPRTRPERPGDLARVADVWRLRLGQLHRAMGNAGMNP